MRLMRHAWHRWVALVFASAALGAACSNSSRGQSWEDPTPAPIICSCIKNADGSVSILDGPDAGCDLDAGCYVVPVLPPPPSASPEGGTGR
jgi:hypothetical protein